MNKIDVMRPEDLSESQKELIRSMEGPGEASASAFLPSFSFLLLSFISLLA